MGTNSAPLLADLFLHTFEYDFMVKTMKQDITKAIQFSNTFRYIDDLCSVNNVDFGNYISAICSAIGIGFNGAEPNCEIARILGILLMNSCDK